MSNKEHVPFTSTVSKPHTSKAEPQEHVDVQHWGADGKLDKELTSEASHVTDSAAVEYGRAMHNEDNGSWDSDNNSGK